jgi:Flp pilus assembly protein TadG
MTRQRRRRKSNSKGQSMVELAIVLPILLLVVCGIIDFGWVFSNSMITSYGTREGARFGTIVADKSDAAAQIKDRVFAVTPAFSHSGMVVTTVFTNTAIPQDGDVKVTVKYTFPLLTPMAQMLFGSNTYSAVNTCQMKAE